MTVFIENALIVAPYEQPLTHARIAHSGNWLTGGTVSASSTATGYYADAPTNSLTYERWKPASLTATWEYNHGSDAECDYCCIAAHTMGTNGNTVEVQVLFASGWETVVSGTPDSDEPIMLHFSPRSRQRWRISISGGTAPEVGVIAFGMSLKMPRPLFGGHAPIPTARQTILRSNYSETGEYLGRAKQRSYLATEYAWEYLTDTWVRDNWPDLQLAIEAEPFFIAWRPGTYGDVAYAQVDEVPVPSIMGVRNYMSVSMSVRARGYD